MKSVEFTGERIIPEVDNYFFYEHVARYRLAKSLIEPGESVIDVGCGDGYGTFYLSSTATEILGVDISAEAIECARTKYQGDNLGYQQVGPERWNIPEGKYDTATCFEVFEHIPEPEKVLRHIHGVLKEDGRIVISTPNREVYGENLPDPYHVKEYSLDEFQAIVARYFDIEKIYGQRNRSQMRKRLNFWAARQTMRHSLLLKLVGRMLAKKPVRRLTPEHLEKLPAHGNFFTENEPSTADYFIIVGRKRA